MSAARTFAVAVAGVVLSTFALHGQDRPGYRNFRLGADLPSVAALTGAAAVEIRTIHRRPVLMQELQWQRPFSGSDFAPAGMDPVKRIVFSFYDNHLSKMVVDYDRDRTAGMTDADVIGALSKEYGTPLLPGAQADRSVVSPLERESGKPIGRWSAGDCAVVLYRSSESMFRVVVTSPRLEALARAAAVDAARLDEREAPAREVARQKRDAADEHARQDESRAANRAAFRP